MLMITSWGVYGNRVIEIGFWGVGDRQTSLYEALVRYVYCRLPQPALSVLITCFNQMYQLIEAEWDVKSVIIPIKRCVFQEADVCDVVWPDITCRSFIRKTSTGYMSSWNYRSISWGHE